MKKTWMHYGFIYHSWTQKSSYRMFPMAAILTKNSQVTIAKWSQSLLSPDGFKPWIFFHPKIIERILLWSFWAVSRLIKPKTDDLRALLVFWSKSPLCRLWPPSRTPISGPKKKLISRQNFIENPILKKRLLTCF